MLRRLVHSLRVATEVDSHATVLSTGKQRPYVRQFYASDSTYVWQDAQGDSHEVWQSEGGEQGHRSCPLSTPSLNTRPLLLSTCNCVKARRFLLTLTTSTWSRPLSESVSCRTLPNKHSISTRTSSSIAARPAEGSG